jgi:hypothetical protein
VHTYLKRNREASLPDNEDNQRKRKLESIKDSGPSHGCDEIVLSSLVVSDELDCEDYGGS